MTRANFTDRGLPVGQNDVNMTYLYGLSDFFSVMFEDTSTVNLLLEATTQGAAEVYSQFLQLTSTLSLQNITETTGASLKLILLNSSDAVIGETNRYTLNETVLSSRYIANRPFLPTSSLEENVDFTLSTDDEGTTTIIFAQDVESYSFSTRTLKDGTKQYAIWFVDAAIDERMLSTYYAQLIGVDPENSTKAFHDFVYGLYYVYVQGPTLDVVRKGLNLTLGIPLARSAETVLDIRNYLDTDQYIVITDSNQYLIPYGLPPSVKIGDTLAVGDELAQWVTIKDYLSDGEWWINLLIPPTIVPSLPIGQKDRYATKGSHFDYLMRNYLKKHTFLVNVKVSSFENIQNFKELSDIIKRAKPAHTQPIYIWTVDTLSETIGLTDDKNFVSRVDPRRCENIGIPIDRFYRNNSVDAPTRSCAQFMRFNVSDPVAKLCGTDAYVNGDPASMNMNGFSVTGFTNFVGAYRSNVPEEAAWLRTILSRGSETWRGKVSQVGYRRAAVDPEGEDGVPAYLSHKAWGTPAGRRVVPLYLTTATDIKTKAEALDFTPPPSATWFFPLFSNVASRAVNSLAINSGPNSTSGKILRENYDTVFSRGTDVAYLGVAVPEIGWKTYAPPVSEILDDDYLLGIRVTENTIGVYWVTRNFTVDAPSYFVVTVNDPLIVTYDAPMNRAGGLNGTPLYALRGRGSLNYNSVETPINSSAINANESVASPIVRQTYVDKYNPNNVVIDRSGVKLVHAIESR